MQVLLLVNGLSALARSIRFNPANRKKISVVIDGLNDFRSQSRFLFADGSQPAHGRIVEQEKVRMCAEEASLITDVAGIVACQTEAAHEMKIGNEFDISFQRHPAVSAVLDRLIEEENLEANWYPYAEAGKYEVYRRRD